MLFKRFFFTNFIQVLNLSLLIIIKLKIILIKNEK